MHSTGWDYSISLIRALNCLQLHNWGLLQGQFTHSWYFSYEWTLMGWITFWLLYSTSRKHYWSAFLIFLLQLWPMLPWRCTPSVIDAGGLLCLLNFRYNKIKIQLFPIEVAGVEWKWGLKCQILITGVPERYKLFRKFYLPTSTQRCCSTYKSIEKRLPHSHFIAFFQRLEKVIRWVMKELLSLTNAACF